MRFRTIINGLGYVLLFLSLYFIFDRLLNNYLSLVSWHPNKTDYLIIIICIIVYALSNFLLSGAWKYLLVLSGHKNISLSKSHIIYGRSQISKYIPGNMFHFIGRYFLGKIEDIPSTALLISTLYENISLFIVASAITIASYTLNGVGAIDGISLYRILFVLVFAFVLAYIAHYYFIKKLSGVSAGNLKANLINAGVCHTAFFVVFATVAVVVFLMVAPDAINGNLYYIFMVFISSWVIGYMTPGAPAGVGVREAVIVLTLGPLSGEAESLIAAFLFRLITVAGDLVFFLLSYLVEAYINRANNISDPI